MPSPSFDVLLGDLAVLWLVPRRFSCMLTTEHFASFFDGGMTPTGRKT